MLVKKINGDTYLQAPINRKQRKFNDVGINRSFYVSHNSIYK